MSEDEVQETTTNEVLPGETSKPAKSTRERRLESHDSPFRGLAGKTYYLRQLFNLIFFLPGFFAGRQAKKIVATGKGKVCGYDDIIYTYPILPITGVLVGLSTMTDSQVALQAMGVIWAASLLIVLATIGEDISGRLIGAFIGVIIAICVAWVVLQTTGTVEVSDGLWKFLQIFDPTFTPGVPLLVSFGIFVLLVYSAVKSHLSLVLHINGNRWSPSKLNTEATFDSENHRCYARTPDWLERAIFGCRDLHIIPILEARSVKAGELNEAAVYSPMPLRVRDRDCFFEDSRGGLFRFRPVLHWLPQGSRTASSRSFFDQCADAQVFQYPLGIDRQSFVTKEVPAHFGHFIERLQLGVFAGWAFSSNRVVQRRILKGSSFPS